MKNVIIRKAVLEDIESIISLIKMRCEWLDENNINQWKVTRTYGKDYYINKINDGKFYVATLNGKICGAFMLQFSKKHYEINEEAIYVHHLVADLKYKGIGAYMLNKIKEIALKEGKKCIRLDNISTNKKLNEYYEKNGFKQIGIIEAEKYDGKNSGIIREYKID